MHSYVLAFLYSCILALLCYIYHYLLPPPPPRTFQIAFSNPEEIIPNISIWRGHPRYVCMMDDIFNFKLCISLVSYRFFSSFLPFILSSFLLFFLPFFLLSILSFFLPSFSSFLSFFLPSSLLSFLSFLTYFLPFFLSSFPPFLLCVSKISTV